VSISDLLANLEPEIVPAFAIVPLSLASAIVPPAKSTKVVAVKVLVIPVPLPKTLPLLPSGPATVWVIVRTRNR
jgi:hypothetical protein